MFHAKLMRDKSRRVCLNGLLAETKRIIKHVVASMWRSEALRHATDDAHRVARD
jgi:hypothetical protein